MTTIAYRNGILAADTQFTDSSGWTLAGTVSKLFRLRDGSIVGISGALETGEAFVNWMDGDQAGDRPTVGDTTRCIHLSEGGVVVYEGTGRYSPKGDFMAWGSGFPVALGAMHMGAEAFHAVEVAAKYDPHTGGAICFMALHDEGAEVDEAVSAVERSIQRGIRSPDRRFKL
jgi:hypothetical protein